MTRMADHFDMGLSPMRIGTVTLKVRDLETTATFYRRVLGLQPVETGRDRIALGTSAEPLLVLKGDPSLAPRDPRQAGLFHTAFLLPARADLGRWFDHARNTAVRLEGASDHIVSEAIYLSDPEGNGIEIYADRPTTRWHDGAGNIRMRTDPLDLQDLLRSADGTKWTGFPEGGTIGHVHLQVGDTAAADRFYRDVLGFDIATDYPGASFYGSGGYHHQLAGNIWRSAKAGSRPAAMAGLDAVEIKLREKDDLASIEARADSVAMAVETDGGGTILRDPWGTAIRLAV